jgi:hypothetical protein
VTQSSCFGPATEVMRARMSSSAWQVVLKRAGGLNLSSSGFAPATFRIAASSKGPIWFGHKGASPSAAISARSRPWTG